MKINHTVNEHEPEALKAKKRPPSASPTTEPAPIPAVRRAVREVRRGRGRPPIPVVI